MFQRTFVEEDHKKRLKTYGRAYWITSNTPPSQKGFVLVSEGNITQGSVAADLAAKFKKKKTTNWIQIYRESYDGKY